MGVRDREMLHVLPALELISKSIHLHAEHKTRRALQDRRSMKDEMGVTALLTSYTYSHASGTQDSFLVQSMTDGVAAKPRSTATADRGR